MTILISGGAGFIGSTIVRLGLARGHRFRILDNLSPQIHGHFPEPGPWLADPRIEFLRGNVCSPEDWTKALSGVATVIHLAAETGTGQSMYEVARYNEVNTQGTAVMLEALGRMTERTVGRVILSSSRSIYGEGAYGCSGCGLARVTPPSRTAAELAAGQWEPSCPVCHRTLGVLATREDDPPRPSSIYAATKYAQEDLVRIGCGALGIDHVIFRFQNVYGEGQSLKNPYTGILSIFSTKVRRGLPLPLFEDGEETRDFVHVDDVAEAVLLASGHSAPLAAVLNVGSGIGSSVRTVAEELSAAFSVKSELVVTGQYRVGDIRHNIADISALAKVLGFTPRISLRAGLNRFAAWVLSQPVPQDRLDQANAELAKRGLLGKST
jgi:dTDP-L-rhamnose 4-epimerase